MTREVNGVAVQVETYEYNALGALKVNASVAVDAKRPRLDGAGVADLAIAATLGAQPVVLDNGGSVTSLRGTQFTWTRAGDLRSITPPSPGTPITYRTDGQQRRLGRSGPSTTLYVNEGPHRVAVVNINAATLERYLFDGIDHPLRTKGTTTAYYEVDLAGNVRRLRAPGGVDLGGYRYTAFGQTLEDTATVAQPLRWKGRPLEVVAGVEIYDMRARQWGPELGAFLTIDEYAFQDATSTLWGWPRQNPLRFSDPSGRWVGTPYQNPGMAGWAAGVEYNGYSIDTNRELAGIIFEKDGSFYHTRAVDTYGNNDHTSFPAAALPLVPKGGRAVGVWHTHANFTPGQNVCTSQPGKNGDKIFSPISPQDRASLKKMIEDGLLPPGAIGTVTTSSGHISLYNSQSTDGTQSYFFNDQFYVNLQGIRSDWHAPVYLDQSGRYLRPDGSTWSP